MMAVKLAKDGNQIIFCCKSNRQVEEKADAFAEQGLSVQCLSGAAYKLKNQKDIDVVEQQALSWFNKPVGLDNLFIIRIGQEMTRKIRTARQIYIPAQKPGYPKLMVEESNTIQQVMELSSAGATASRSKQQYLAEH